MLRTINLSSQDSAITQHVLLQSLPTYTKHHYSNLFQLTAEVLAWYWPESIYTRTRRSICDQISRFRWQWTGNAIIFSGKVWRRTEHFQASDNLKFSQTLRWAGEMPNTTFSWLDSRQSTVGIFWQIICIMVYIWTYRGIKFFVTRCFFTYSERF